MSRHKIPAAQRARAASLDLFNAVSRANPAELDKRIDAVIAARKAQDAGKARHAGTRKKRGTDWESVRAAIIADGHADSLTPPIRAKELHKLPQLRALTAESVQTFIKFLREQYVIPSKNK